MDENVKKTALEVDEIVLELLNKHSDDVEVDVE